MSKALGKSLGVASISRHFPQGDLSLPVLSGLAEFRISAVFVTRGVGTRHPFRYDDFPVGLSFQCDLSNYRFFDFRVAGLKRIPIDFNYRVMDFIGQRGPAGGVPELFFRPVTPRWPGDLVSFTDLSQTNIG
jgi:hypothetical protein